MAAHTRVRPVAGESARATLAATGLRRVGGGPRGVTRRVPRRRRTDAQRGRPRHVPPRGSTGTPGHAGRAGRGTAGVGPFRELPGRTSDVAPSTTGLARPRRTGGRCTVGELPARTHRPWCTRRTHAAFP